MCDARAQVGGVIFLVGPEDRPPHVLSTVFLLSTVVTGAKILRDRDLASRFENELLARHVRGTPASAVVVAVTAAAALWFTFSPLVRAFVASAAAGQAGVLLIAQAYMVTAAANAAKVLRDRFDADWLTSAVAGSMRDRSAEFTRIAYDIARGTGAFSVINYMGLLGGAACVFWGITSAPTLNTDKKVILSLLIVFLAFSAMNVSKLARDNLEGVPNTAGWKVFSIFMFVASAVCAFAAPWHYSTTGELSREVFWFDAVGTMWMLSSVMSVSKLVRDAEARKKHV